MKVQIDKVVVRAYAIIVENNNILLSDEFWYDTPMTKFPGGALIPGESIQDCLIRELKEELNIAPLKIRHFYTYDKLVVSAFHALTQVIPIYYLVDIPKNLNLNTAKHRYDFFKLEEGAIRLRWMQIESVTPDEFTFESDRNAFLKYYDEIYSKSKH